MHLSHLLYDLIEDSDVRYQSFMRDNVEGNNVTLAPNPDFLRYVAVVKMVVAKGLWTVRHAIENDFL